ncbi:MAG: hypothetical protein LBK99_17445 [Opitutaceae bacterium]|jgi:hypothetical protein|nr:hypothetical protein [Opitutaceae bacterium]
MKRHRSSTLKYAAGAPFVFALLSMQNLCAALPTSGDGWTLTEQSNGNYSIHADIESATAYNSAAAYTWQLLDNGSFKTSETSLGGTALTPAAGTNFFYGEAAASGNRGIGIVFKDVPVQAGTYTLTFKVAAIAIEGKTFPYPSSGSMGKAGLTADVNDNGYTSDYPGNGELLGAVASEMDLRPQPTTGGWVTWTYHYTVTDKTTISSTAALGHDLGFRILVNTANTAWALDDLTISFVSATPVPEPRTVTAFFGAGALLVAGCASLVLRRREK